MSNPNVKIEVLPPVPLKEDGTINFDKSCNDAFTKQNFNPYLETIKLYKQLDDDAPQKVALAKALLSIAEARCSEAVQTQPIIINAISTADIPKPPNNFQLPGHLND